MSAEMGTEITPEMFSAIYTQTVLGVSVILAAGGIGFAIGCGLICAKTIDCLTRLPETRPILMADMFIFTGFMGNFPFIILAFGMWFLFANPFAGAFQAAVRSLASGVLLMQ